mmetsp:Transcript_40913/g.55739  ORF Transcript_40913/g.55739 Transcript_40913/m.55739 type:complete len:365 (-) Transcript_40913:883-1977(-)|eukprot:CAMPEP_0185779062 /NCGR_PEP_ID=MMETSP1174-20130828/94550_1 /TAXON_ID=35687 /ORGANISM="Dictyocha speculum, Strain CCMP1381" /LENGTH=364 /DNA_ID=CAMNT_0028468025 /DNA_START=74 /DNA_END=1168 /DNA_ORIENTATION=+
MRSPYAAPESPIASAKRPRPNNISTAKPDRINESEKENDSAMPLSPLAKAANAGRTPIPTDSEESRNGKWRGHMGALFSPVLRFLGGDEEGELEDESLRAEQDEQGPELASSSAVTEVQEIQDEIKTQQEVEPVAAEEHDAEDDDEFYEEFNPYLFMKQLPPYAEVGANVRPQLPPRRFTRNAPVTLVLDLDETLVHCSVTAGPKEADIVFPVHFNGNEYQVHVQKRPHLEFFLREAAKNFEVVIFTASQQMYADKLLDTLDPNHDLIKHRLFRDSCLMVDGNYLKDLNVVGRDLSKMVLVDNSPHAFGYQIDNGIPIESWFGEPKDEELLRLLEFLEQLRGVDDVRPIVRHRFRTVDLIANAQ